MKLLLVVAACLVGVALALPAARDPEYAVVPDGHGSFKLINVNEDPSPQPFFNAEQDTFFTLFTRANPGGEIIRDEDSVRNSNFSAANPTRFIVHGWQSNGRSDVNILITREYLALGEFNVIVVDWGVGAETVNYLASRNNVGSVGAVTARFIQMINRATGASPGTMSIIGHSLGAHIAGFAGKNLLGEQRLGSIVAMDAALPLFHHDRPAERVNENDAEYVESIHTNAGLLGFDLPLGTANFYPNGGSSQPGCGIDVVGNCAHSRAWEYFAESITSTRHFWSRRCRSYEEILSNTCTASGLDMKMGGEPVNGGASGIYWTTTNRASPFATGIL